MIDCVCFSRLHADIITSFKLINIPEVAHKNPFKCDYGIGQQRCYIYIYYVHQTLFFPSQCKRRKGKAFGKESIYW